MVNEITYLAGYLLLIFSFFLSNKYQLFYKNRILFYLILFILFAGVLFSNIMENAYYTEVDVTIWHILNNVNFLITSILLIIIVFEDDIRKLSNENKRLFRNLDKSKLFVNLGENITHLVHNMKNDIIILDIAKGMLEEQESLKPHSPNTERDEITPLQCLTEGKERLSLKVNSIMNLTHFSQSDEPSEFNISKLIDSHLEVFKLNKDFKQIKIQKDYQENDTLNGNPMEISLIIENLLKNTFEALFMKWEDTKDNNIKYNPTLQIKSFSNSSHNILSIKDNGPGIPICIKTPCNNNCINCSVFKIGKTVKDHGTGLGMISIIRTLKKYNGYFQIKTSLDGSEIEVYLIS